MIGEHVELRSEPGAELWSVIVDLGQLEQVLINLTVNARDAMPEGGALTLTTRNVELDGTLPGLGDRRGPHVELTVADTGVGIPDDVRPQIFDPCFTTREPGHGTGLGLATCQAIISRADGAITVESEVGAGTRFHVYLPRTLARAEHALTPELAVVRGHETILMVEDDAWLRHAMSKSLAELGYHRPRWYRVATTASPRRCCARCWPTSRRRPMRQFGPLVQHDLAGHHRDLHGILERMARQFVHSETILSSLSSMVQ